MWMHWIWIWTSPQAVLWYIFNYTKWLFVVSNHETLVMRFSPALFWPNDRTAAGRFTHWTCITHKHWFLTRISSFHWCPVSACFSSGFSGKSCLWQNYRGVSKSRMKECFDVDIVLRSCLNNVDPNLIVFKKSSIESSSWRQMTSLSRAR